MEKTLIEVKNLSYTYPTQGENNLKKNEMVLNDLNFKVAKGEFVGIIGRNGSGKSTLAKLLNAILIPDQGDVIIDGMNTKDDEHLWTIRQTAGMVFQNPDNQLVATIVEEDVAFGPENLGIPSEEIKRRVEAALKTVNMGVYKKKKPHQLSGGQKQRIAIAGILAMDPKCIIFDEATAMLDPQGRKEVMSTIWKLNREQGLTVLYITHHMEELIEADRILVMDGGKIVLEGQPKKIFAESELLKRYHLDVPQMTALAVALNQKGIKVPSDCLSVSEMAAALTVSLPMPHEQKYRFEDTLEKTEPAEIAKRPFVLRTEHLEHIYSKGSPFEQVALQDMNVSIHQGEFIGLIGHTGCGKTTFIQHLNGLMSPTEGKVFFEDQNIFTQGKKALLQVRRKVGLVFQYPEYQLFEETVAKDVAFGPLKAGLSEKEVMERVDWALDIVGLKDDSIKEASPFSLSGGQMRRVAIAGILAMKPKVLILDEPTAGLDPYGRTEILNQISRMHRQEKMTVILISHSMEDISHLADRIMVMHQGKLVLFDRPKAIFDQSNQLTSIGLDVPEVTSLINQLREKKYPVPSGIFTVDQVVSVLTSLFDQKKEVIHD